ncbi:MAG: type II toxin-antitoxin system PemK/MazF family toxin [Flavisolibacter sp.]|nr:type II toxin-antitoxin system PemK/MazF family toxin [Flavisolibacter sp.]MBD0298371.1 type II toxin-antitoxin system PemK/MazF family toxin [Flavisolibacter sp.]
MADRHNLMAVWYKLKEDCDIMIDQIRAIDNKRLQKKIGAIPEELEEKIKENIRIVLDL